MKKIRKVLMLVTVALWAAAPWSAAQAQNASRKPVTVDMKSVSVKDFFAEIKKQTGLSFMYDATLASTWPKVTIKARRKPAEEVIDEVVLRLGCEYKINGDIVTISGQKQSGSVRLIQGKVKDAIKKLKKVRRFQNNGKSSSCKC